MPLHGPSLAAALYRSAPPWRPSWAQLLPAAAQLAQAMARVHAAGIIHRDVKPANILVDGQDWQRLREGGAQEAPRLLLADFGLAEDQVEGLEPAAVQAAWAAASSGLPGQQGPGGRWQQGPGRCTVGTHPSGGFHKQAMVRPAAQPGHRAG
ncbi:hypothetical protein V8C86DRAFT_2811531 [Haematococcus lacustris]